MFLVVHVCARATVCVVCLCARACAQGGLACMRIRKCTPAPDLCARAFRSFLCAEALQAANLTVRVQMGLQDTKIRVRTPYSLLPYPCPALLFLYPPLFLRRLVAARSASWAVARVCCVPAVQRGVLWRQDAGASLQASPPPCGSAPPPLVRGCVRGPRLQECEMEIRDLTVRNHMAREERDAAQRLAYEAKELLKQAETTAEQEVCNAQLAMQNLKKVMAPAGCGVRGCGMRGCGHARVRGCKGARV